MEVQENQHPKNENIKIAIYPGAFKFFHEAHFDVVKKALTIFDQVIILCCDQPNLERELYERAQNIAEVFQDEDQVGVGYWTGLLAQYLQGTKVSAIIRPFKDSTDLRKEQTIIYTNEDLGVSIPFLYIPVSRSLSHITTRTYEILDNFTEQGGSNASTN